MVKTAETEGVIFRIKRFSVHDGPGIRTSVFLKGCPMNCIWCHSPEGINQDITIWYNGNLCIACGQCIQACPEKAITAVKSEEQFIRIERELCKVSGKCVRICPSTALQFTGNRATVSETVSELEKDMLFYETSDGGVTLTGGEPLYQPGFSSEILKECRKRKIHTAVETSLFCDRDTLDLVSDYVDLFIIDIKFIDSDLHRFYTGKRNDAIKDNFHYIADQEKKILVRIPLIENITNTSSNIKDIADFVNETRNDIQIEKIDYNPLTGNNYRKLGIPFLLK